MYVYIDTHSWRHDYKQNKYLSSSIREAMIKSVAVGANMRQQDGSLEYQHWVVTYHLVNFTAPCLVMIRISDNHRDLTQELDS